MPFVNHENWYGNIKRKAPSYPIPHCAQDNLIEFMIGPYCRRKSEQKA